jgi:hypothetical protein
LPQRITTETHTWVVAACIPVDQKTAKRAVDRQSLRANMLSSELKIEALDVYCSECRRPMDDVGDLPCEAYESNEHLRGGPIGERAKRKHRYHDCDELDCFPNGIRTDDGPPLASAR